MSSFVIQCSHADRVVFFHDRLPSGEVQVTPFAFDAKRYDSINLARIDEEIVQASFDKHNIPVLIQVEEYE